MKQTKIIMGMPITAEIIDKNVTQSLLDKVFDYFVHVDKVFSTYKKDSEISKINRRELALQNASAEVQSVFKLSEQTKKETNGYFDIVKDGFIDPSGLVKGWAIQNAAEMLSKNCRNYYVEAGGDIQVCGLNAENKKWKIGIRNPFKKEEIIKTLCLSSQGIATSGTYERGEHIYDPYTGKVQVEIVSFTVIGPNIYEADRFATAAFAMGKKGIAFIEEKKDLEGYMIDKVGIATMTSGFEKYVC